MGASKGVLLSGIALIVGMYAVGIKKADAIIASSAGTRVYQIQSDANARSGLRFAIQYMRTASWSDKKRYPTSGDFKVFMSGDTITYNIDTRNTPNNIAILTSTSKFKGVVTTIQAELQRGAYTYTVGKRKRTGYNWTITKSYLVPTNEANQSYY